MEDEKLRAIVHGKLLELLKFVNSICSQEQIKYSLCGGTLLGAVRHDGFIPWDDDADIVMTREEFNRFVSVSEKYLDGSDFTLYKNGRVDGITFRNPIECEGVNLSHLCCDIFILDNVPDDDKLYRKQIFALKKLQGMMKKGKVDWKHYSLKGKILVAGTKILGVFYSEKSLLKKYELISTKYNNQSTKRKFISNDVFSTFDIPYDNETLEQVEPHKFETEYFPIFSHYDSILTKIYGDYMTPPPVEERKFLHADVN